MGSSGATCEKMSPSFAGHTKRGKAMKTRVWIFSLGLVLGLSSLLMADVLRLQNGDVIEGTYLGGTSRTVKFIDSEGNVNTYDVSAVDGVRFRSGTSAEAPPPRTRTRRPRRQAAVRSQAPAPAEMGVTVPAGMLITVRTIDSIDADVTGAGERFRASIDDPVVVDGQVVIPRGADATIQVIRVEQAGRVAGSDEVALKLFDVTVEGQIHEIASNYAEVKTRGKGKQTAKTMAVTTGIGAALGAIIGGGKGAAIGAGAGAGTGIAVSAARGKKLRIPSETRLDFELRSPLPL